MDGSGNLYGAGAGGGPNNGSGTVFEVSPNRDGSWGYHMVHSFSDWHKDGSSPNGGLVFDMAGNLYGTTAMGGTNDEGTVFELTPGSSGWTLSVLYNFGNRPGDGSSPVSGLAMDKLGDLYGIAGAVLFELAPVSGSWTENVLYTFCGIPPCPNGSVPWAAPILDGSDNLYGTTEQGGYSNCGVVYELKHISGGDWKEHVLYRFRCGSDGADPSGSLIFDSSGNLYGTAASGCIGQGGCSAVFKLTRKPRGGWTESVLHKFVVEKDGIIPTGNIVFDKAGNLYGITIAGGTGNCSGGCGVIYKLTPAAQGKWKYSVLHRFQGPDGVNPSGGLIIDGKGHLYGGTPQGGLYGGGVVFQMTP
jgi:uncharacterized repeat protein (TIGR03803 family)